LIRFTLGSEGFGNCEPNSLSNRLEKKSKMILEIDVQTSEDGIPLMHLKGEIDLHTCAPFRDTLRELIDQQRYNIVIDLSEVPYLDSAALGVLVDAVRRVREFNGAIYLVAPTPFVRRAFDITRLIKIFRLCETKEDALSEIKTAETSDVAAS
jgi:anti-sigma B factor antagonist